MAWSIEGIVGGTLLGGTGLGLMAAGMVWKGRATRPFAPRRARRMAHRTYLRDLTRATDQAIVAARRGRPAAGLPAARLRGGLRDGRLPVRAGRGRPSGTDPGSG